MAVNFACKLINLVWRSWTKAFTKITMLMMIMCGWWKAHRNSCIQSKNLQVNHLE